MILWQIQERRGSLANGWMPINCTKNGIQWLSGWLGLWWRRRRTWIIIIIVVVVVVIAGGWAATVVQCHHCSTSSSTATTTTTDTTMTNTTTVVQYVLRRLFVLYTAKLVVDVRRDVEAERRIVFATTTQSQPVASSHGEQLPLS